MSSYPGALLVEWARRSQILTRDAAVLSSSRGATGVHGLIIVNADGIPIRTTLDHETSVQYAALISTFTQKARAVLKCLPLPGASLEPGAVRDKLAVQKYCLLLRVRARSPAVHCCSRVSSERTASRAPTDAGARDYHRARP